MAMNYSSTWRTPKSFTNESTGVKSDSGPYIGVVMDNYDPTRNGRVDVWLKTHTGGDKTDPSRWRTISYLPSFYGTTPFNYNDKTESKFDKNGHSYGMWFTSPDVGVEVLCFFVEGSPNEGYYVGYIPQTQMNHMIPATGASKNNTPSPGEESAYSNATQLPVVEITKSLENNNNSDFHNIKKPIHSVLASQFWQQGTITDNIRGPIGTSVQRESPSYAYGISTPGRPIYSGGMNETNFKENLQAGDISKETTKVEGRRGGHSFSMDDGDANGNDVLMRLRTATGHQITMSDDGGCIYIQHANGQTWMEFGNEGAIDLYSSNSINLRTQGELNFHADNGINFYSGKNVNMFAKDNIKLECNKEFNLIGKEQLKMYSEQKLFLKSDGVLSSDSAQNTTINAGGNIVGKGSSIYLNTMAADVVTKPVYVSHTKLPDSEINGANGWGSIPEKLDSVVTRAPTHEPYAHHNEGVPVPVTIGAPSALAPKPAPVPTQRKINETKEQPAPAQPVEIADVAKQATTTTNSKEIGAMDKAAVASTLSQHAKSINQPLATISDSGLGKYGIKPELLESLGILKPGLIDISNTSIGDVFNKLADPAMFTGELGINSLNDILNSEEIQTQIAQNGMSQANAMMEQLGILTGAESALETASILGASLVASPSDISDWIAGKGSATLNNLIDNVAKASQYAVGLAEGPAKEVMQGITEGFPSVSQAITAGTSNREAIDAFTNSLISNPKIPDVSAISNKIKSNISGSV